MRELTHRAKEHFALIWRKDRPTEKLAIFVHGFRGNYLTTWGGLGDLLQKEADSKAVFEDWDYLFLGYETSKVSTYLDIAHFIWTEWRKAAGGDAPYEHSYKTLALFGHSLGTLGIRQALCAHSKQPANMLSALHGVTYFGSPANGSKLARFAPLTDIAYALKPGNPQLRMLKGWVEDVHVHAPWPPIRVVTGIDDKVVGYQNGELMEWAGDRLPPDLTHTDHSGLVKPDGWNTMIIDHIKNCLK
jgi:Putative serine esterase (DUF676)